MNVFQLTMILSPLMGLLGGMYAADGHGAAHMIVGAGTGLLTGLAIYPGAVHLVTSLSTTLGLPNGSGAPPTTPWWVWALFGYAFASPCIAFFISAVAVRWLMAR